MRRRAMLLTIVAAFGIALSLGVGIGARIQQRKTAAEIDRLTRFAAMRQASVQEDLDSLPAVVARYLRWAIPEPLSLRSVRLRQVGMLRTDVETGRWMDFTAEHIAAPAATGFVWNARVAIAPSLHVQVVDAFVEGRGSGRVALLSAVTVSADAGTPEMNSGSLHRFLAEAVWYPTALLPSAKLRWTAIDENTALATLTDHDVAVALEFRFADTGEVTGIFTPARWGTFEGGYQQRPWEGHFRNYQLRDGLRVPTEGDVGWYFENEWQPVWRGSITSFEAKAN